MKQNNLIITAVMSKLISDRDSVLTQLDLAINKNIFNNGTSDAVNQIAELFKNLSIIESAIETVQLTINNNTTTNKISEQIGELTETINHLQDNQNTDNHGISS